jgi:hypothetical protein
MLNFQLLLDATMLVRFSWLKTQVQGVRTHHIDTRYHFVPEHIEDGLIKIVFVKSRINDADMFTANLGKEAHEKHVNKFLGKIQNSNLEYRG